jgi:hypothetical protein
MECRRKNAGAVEEVRGGSSARVVCLEVCLLIREGEFQPQSQRGPALGARNLSSLHAFTVDAIVSAIRGCILDIFSLNDALFGGISGQTSCRCGGMVMVMVRVRAR